MPHPGGGGALITVFTALREKKPTHKNGDLGQRKSIRKGYNI